MYLVDWLYFPNWEKWHPVGSSSTFLSGYHSCMLQEYPCWVALVLLSRQAGYCGWSPRRCWALVPLTAKSCLLADGWGEAQELLRPVSAYWYVGPVLVTGWHHSLPLVTSSPVLNWWFHGGDITGVPILWLRKTRAQGDWNNLSQVIHQWSSRIKIETEVPNTELLTPSLFHSTIIHIL